MKKWKFRARLVKDDERTGFKKDRKFDPKGFYYSGKNVILVGSVAGEHTERIAFPVDSVEVEVKRA